MKKSLVLLGLSLAANAAAVAVFLVHAQSRHGAAPGSPTAAMVPPPATDADSSRASLSPADIAALKRSGELMATGDLRMLVARLRAAGFSPTLVRAIVTAQVTDDFGRRRKAVVARQEVVPYWKSTQSFPHDAKAGADIARLYREQKALLKDLLGPDATPADEWSQLLRQRQYGSLSAEKIDRIEAIRDDYSDLRGQVSADAHGVFLQEDMQRMALLEKEQRKDLANVLTPQELEEYDLRTSNVANQLRFQLAAFEPTEEEFKTIFRLTQAAQPQGGAPGPNWRAAQDQLAAQIAAALGPERAAAYQQARDPAYQQAAQILTRLDLPVARAADIVAVQKDVQQRAGALRQDQTLSADERASQLAALAAEAQTQLTASLGERGYQAYLERSGYWLNQLQNKPVPGVSFAIPIR